MVVPAKSDTASAVESTADVVDDPPSNLIMIGDSTLDINEKKTMWQNVARRSCV